MEINIEIMPAYKTAYIRKVGLYGVSNIQIMEELKNWAMSKHLLNDDSIIFGVVQDNPEIIKPDCCRYDVCLVTSDNYCIVDDYISKGKIIEGRYAIFTIDHTKEAIQKSWNEIFLELPKQNYQIDYTKPIMERYVLKKIKTHKCEICVPIY